MAGNPGLDASEAKICNKKTIGTAGKMRAEKVTSLHVLCVYVFVKFVTFIFQCNVQCVVSKCQNKSMNLQKQKKNESIEI